MTRDEALRQIIEAMDRSGWVGHDEHVQELRKVLGPCLDTYRQSIERETIERAAKVIDSRIFEVEQMVAVTARFHGGQTPFTAQMLVELGLQAAAIRALLPPSDERNRGAK